MIYSFKKETGEFIDLKFPMGECPSEVICDDGVKAVRVFCAPFVAIKKSGSSERQDDAKWRNEAMERASELGMRNFIPMKGQSSRQQVKDLIENQSEFKDQMAKANEETAERQLKKMKAVSEKNARTASVEKHLKRAEKKKEADYKKRSISL